MLLYNVLKEEAQHTECPISAIFVVQETFVCSFFDDFSLLHHNDFICLFDGRKSMGNSDCRSTFGDLVQCSLN